MASRVGGVQQGERPGAKAIHGWRLQWVWPEIRLVKLEASRVSIGSSPSSELQLSGAGVSHCHAELHQQGSWFVLRALESENGTWLSGARVVDEIVTHGQVLRIGGWVGVFSLGAPTACGFGELMPGLFGGPELSSLLEPLRRAAVTDIPVLLIGETGTGKECFARATHELSGRRGPFFPINCAALPEQMAEAELFGYRRGAFTGAERASIGYFRSAHTGTLFLDEVAELSPHVQAKLLRVLDDGYVLGLGESKPVRADVRIVAASQRPLRELVASGRFRRDLAARVTGLELVIPPLAKRRADIGGLFSELVKGPTDGHQPPVEAKLVEALCLYDWPQNVRELALVTRTLLALHGHEPLLQLKHLSQLLAGSPEERSIPIRRKPQARNQDALELACITQALLRSGGNIKAAAAALGISRQRVYRMLNAASKGEAPRWAARE
jgi:DNA-binding NtrC family response regulator